MALYLVRDGAARGADLDAAREGARRSPYVFGEGGAAGLSATFTTSGIPELRERFDYLARVLDTVRPPRTYRRLFGWRERLTELLATNRPNAFYLKLVVLRPGEGLPPRVATTLQRRVNAPHPHPRVVSCLFLDVPDAGEPAALRLHHAGVGVADVPAAAGRLVQLRGELGHEITAAGGQGAAVTLIALCEQYSFAGPVAERLAPFKISSAPRFEAALSEAHDKGAPDFLVDGVDGEARPARDLLR